MSETQEACKRCNLWGMLLDCIILDLSKPCQNLESLCTGYIQGTHFLIKQLLSCSPDDTIQDVLLFCLLRSYFLQLCLLPAPAFISQEIHWLLQQNSQSVSTSNGRQSWFWFPYISAFLLTVSGGRSLISVPDKIFLFPSNYPAHLKT